MAPSSTGAVVLVPFPFSNLAQAKLRPALVLASAANGDWILCQITSNPFFDLTAVEIQGGDFSEGSLHRISYARPGKLFTAHESLFISEAGKLSKPKFATILAAIERTFADGLLDYK